MTDPATPERLPRLRRWLPWIALVLLLVVAQSLLVWLTVRHESERAQDEADAVAAETAAEARRELFATMRALQALGYGQPLAERWRAGAAELLRAQRPLLRVERRGLGLDVVDAVDRTLALPLFEAMPRRSLDADTRAACGAARHLAGPAFSRSYFVPGAGGIGQEVVDVCVPVIDGYLVGTVGLAPLLETALSPRQARGHELSFIEGGGTRLARSGLVRGAGVFQAERLIDIPGTGLRLRADSAAGRPRLIPNVATALVLGLSLALFAVVLLLARDVRRRAQVERALGEALAFRQAMEDSLVTGLRARDLDGRITYVNPAFRAMVGFSDEEMRQPVPPYWPPEHVALYTERQRGRLAGGGRPASEARAGFETVFMRKNGERFPVLIYEAALVDGKGRQTGWMSSVLDVSAQRRVEELSRQQQDRLQASARLATVGEMASLLSHELNQPLAAIASYATGSLNVLDDAAADGARPDPMLRQALERIAEQAERAGRVIKSVHHFVRRRAQQRETVGVDQLVDAVLPLVRLQARKSGTRVQVECPKPAPRVDGDRTMLEQVLLNLTRNGIQAMESQTPLEERVLRLQVAQPSPQRVEFTVSDAGPGITTEVAEQLFTPFFTTRVEGMGLGLSLCRTVVEQHGGTLEFGPGPSGRGTSFRFTLPAARRPTPPASRPHAAPADG